MSKTSGLIVTHAISRAVPPMRPSRAWLCALAGLIGLASAGLAGLIMAFGFWLRGTPTVAGFGTALPMPGSGGARGHAPADPAATRNVATAPRGTESGPERPPSRPVGSRPPQPPRESGHPPAAVAADPPARAGRSLGRELFARTWLPDDPRCHGGDGLGPVYNATSCLDCHNQGGPGGGGPADRNVELATGIGYMLSPGTRR